MTSKNEKKQAIAQTIYMAGDKSLAEVAELMQLSSRTVEKWSTEGNWAKLRASRAITPQRLLDDLYMLVNQVVEQVNKRADRVANQDEAGTIAKLADAIKKMQTDVGIVEIVGVCSRLINFIRQIDLDVAKEMSKYIDAFIKDSVRA